MSEGRAEAGKSVRRLPQEPRCEMTVAWSSTVSVETANSGDMTRSQSRASRFAHRSGEECERNRSQDDSKAISLSSWKDRRMGKTHPKRGSVLAASAVLVGESS